MWCISAFTPDNGPLRVIPGSRRVDQNPADALSLGCEMGRESSRSKDRRARRSLILFNNADLWHSGTFNYSPAPRLAVTVALLRGRAPADQVPAGRQPAGVQQQRNPPPGRWRPTKRLDRVRGLSGRHQVGARGPGGGCGGVQTRLAIPNTRDVSGAPRSRPEGYSVDRVIIDPEVGEFEAVGLQRRTECCQGEIVIVADQDRIGGWPGCPFLARSVRQP